MDSDYIRCIIIFYKSNVKQYNIIYHVKKKPFAAPAPAAAGSEVHGGGVPAIRGGNVTKTVMCG